VSTKILGSILPLICLFSFAQSVPATHLFDIKSADGTLLKATYFAAAKPGPGLLLFHQSQRTRESWKDLATQLAAAGINTLTIDSRAKGESGGTADNWYAQRPNDLDAAFEFLVSQPGVDRTVIGVGGAGNLGVESAVETARRHPSQVRSMVLLSGETEPLQMRFLHQASGLPGLFVFSDEDEYTPTQEAMQLLYAASSSPAKKLIHYPAVQEAPWLWYETFRDSGKVPAKGGHGTDMFKSHPELPQIIVEWLVTTLITTPGHAPADPIAAAPILMDVQFSSGLARATEQLREARKQDPEAQLWPEISMTSIGEDFMREGDNKTAIEVFMLNLLAYPDSADVEENLAEAYLAAGEKDLARQAAEKSLQQLKVPGVPASSWTDTEQYRGEIRKGAEQVLKTSSTQP
jgi:dienelactone hydrolase